MACSSGAEELYVVRSGDIRRGQSDYVGTAEADE